jgi:hypothetical protein
MGNSYIEIDSLIFRTTFIHAKDHLDICQGSVSVPDTFTTLVYACMGEH